MRLIDADELINSILNYCDMYDLYLPKHFIGMIEDAQTIEAVPVVHGEWIKSQSMRRSAKCSECKGWITRHSVNELWFRYCPHCGARMKV